MDLKSFREDKLKIMTQAEFAALLGVEISNVIKWEEDESNIRYLDIQNILEKTNTKYEEVTGWEKPTPKPLDVDNTWREADFTKRTVADYIATALTNADISDQHRKAYVDGLCNGMKNIIVKPKVAMVGRSDTGKSRLINALIGADKMPADWTPMTSIAIYIKHISDKPDFIEEDVWIFTDRVGDEDLWNECRLYDEDYCRSWKIGAGGSEILRSYGTRQGEICDQIAGAAVIFLDAPILNVCDILDLPGFGTERSSDDNITFKAVQNAEIVIYLSQAIGFMRIEDITYLKRNIRELPVWENKHENKLLPLSNLFIVASHAHTVGFGNRVTLERILDSGCSRILETLPDQYWENRKKVSGYDYIGYGKQELRSRFFTYTTDLPSLCTSFHDALRLVLESLPKIINVRAKSFVREYVKTREPNLLNELRKYEELVVERDKYITLLDEIKSNELSRILENDKRKNEVRKAIHSFRDESIKEFSEYVSGVLNTDYIVQMMKEKGIKKKKGDIELFISLFISMLQGRCEFIITAKSEKLLKKTNDYITAYGERMNHTFDNHDIKLDFDAEWAFMSGMAAAGIIGGVAIFAPPVGGAVSGLLSRLGLSLLGPLSMGIGIILGGLGIYALFAGDWKKDIAKKIITALEENDFDGKARDAIRDYWARTEKSFDQAAAVLDAEWESYVNDLQKTVEECDKNDIQSSITSLKCIETFFHNIPL